MRGRRRRQQEAGSGESYWISFSDLMTALLFVFILAVMALMLQLTQQQKALTNQQDEFTEQISTLQTAELMRADMLREIKAELEDAGIEVLVTENHSVVSIPSSLLGFDASSHEIKKTYEPVSLAIGNAISAAISKDDRMDYLDTIFVEGHTDNLAFNGLDGAGNWGLSTFRAISLWKLWEEQLPRNSNLDSLTNVEGRPLFSVSGYGETRPATESQDSDKLRAANRRIDIRFTITRPDSDALLDIGKALEKGAP